MKKVVQTENYSGLKGELIKLTGKDIITKATNKFNEIIDWNYQMLINGKVECLFNGHLTSVKSKFQSIYQEQSHYRIWKKQK
tara:strand:+ start:588 stop:833 length:246 start_codon:yes stop_codon:yes gene_type:complete